MEKGIEKKLDGFFSQFRIVSFQKGETIISAGEEIDAIYYLKKGLVRQSFITENGEEITHHIFKPIAYFPIMLVLSETPNIYSFTALEDIAVHKAPVEQVIAFLKKEPDVLFDLTQRFAQGLTKLLVKNNQMLFKDAYEKVTSLLVYLTQKFGEGERMVTVPLPVTHSDLASWLGMQRETVSRQIEKLQKKGLVQYKNNTLFIPDVQQLEQEAALATY